MVTFGPPLFSFLRTQNTQLCYEKRATVKSLEKTVGVSWQTHKQAQTHLRIEYLKIQMTTKPLLLQIIASEASNSCLILLSYIFKVRVTKLLFTTTPNLQEPPF